MIKIFLQYVKIGFNQKKIYKRNIFASIVVAILEMFLIYSLWNAIFENNNSLEKLDSTIIYLVFMRLLMLMNGSFANEIYRDIKNGNISLKLFKPYPYELGYIGESLGKSLFNLCSVGIIYILLLLFYGELNLFTVIIMIIPIINGFILFSLMELIISLFAYYNYSIWGIESLKGAIQMIFSGAYFPLYFYPKIIQSISAFLPFQYIYASLGSFLTNPEMDGFFHLIILQGFFILIMMGCYLLLKKSAIKKLVIQGG